MLDLLNWDRKITTLIRTWGQPWYGFWKFIASQSIGLYVGFALVLAIFQRLHFGHFVVIIGSAYTLASLLQMCVKRERPDFHSLTGYTMWRRTYSFPSAHATTSSAAALALIWLTDVMTLSEIWIIAGGGLVLAGMIGISRLIVGVHYAADVISGWALGFMVAWGYVSWIGV